MLQIARLARKTLGDSADLVRDFVINQQNPDGGFHGRSSKSDLYYTVFALDCLIALEATPNLDTLQEFLSGFPLHPEFDFVHLCGLARAKAALYQLQRQSRTAQGETPQPEPASFLWHSDFSSILSSYRASDGGFHPVKNQKHGTAYGGFLGLGAYQDLKEPLPDPMRLVQSFKFLETDDGAWANEYPLSKIGATNATAAAVTVLRQFDMPIHERVGQWILQQAHPLGGFLAVPMAPVPDLLSTATALHALSCLSVPLGSLQDRCLDFLDTLWTNEGSFHAHWHEEMLDVEYTFYGLLALGHLSV